MQYQWKNESFRDGLISLYRETFRENLLDMKCMSSIRMGWPLVSCSLLLLKSLLYVTDIARILYIPSGGGVTISRVVGHLLIIFPQLLTYVESSLGILNCSIIEE